MKTETELLISNTTIPTLIPIDTPRVVKDIVNYDGDYFEDYLTEIGYTWYFVDQFEHVLPKGSPKLKLLDDGFYRLKKETDYIAFLTDIFKNNGSNAILFNLGDNFSDIETCVNKIERFDKIDKFIILNIHKTFIDSEAYSISDKTLFEFFIRGMLREGISNAIYFDKLDIVLLYGFDMSIPIFIKNSNQISELKKKAKKFDIYLRSRE